MISETNVFLVASCALFLALTSSSSFSAPAGDLTVVRNGQPEAAIVLRESASPPERLAVVTGAETLNGPHLNSEGLKQGRSKNNMFSGEGYLKGGFPELHLDPAAWRQNMGWDKDGFTADIGYSLLPGGRKTNRSGIAS